jgi:hypothetical protein
MRTAMLIHAGGTQTATIIKLPWSVHTRRSPPKRATREGH